VTKRSWRALGCITGVAAIAAVAILAQACGGGSASEDASPTATSPAAAAARSATPGAGPSFTFGAGPNGAGLVIGGASEELAGFLGIPQEQLQSELDAEGATLASVAEAHDRTREELKTFYTEQQQTQLDEAVSAGTMSQEQADQALEDFASRLDDMIDGNMAVGGGPNAGGFGVGGPGQALSIAGPSEELAAFLDVPLEQLESELSADGATPASVAEAHGRTRDELKTFYTEQLQAQLLEQVAAGTISVEEADSMTARLASTIDDIIDGKVPSGGPVLAPTPSGQ
jgi:phage gp36-like protein